MNERECTADESVAQRRKPALLSIIARQPGANRLHKHDIGKTRDYRFATGSRCVRFSPQ